MPVQTVASAALAAALAASPGPTPVMFHASWCGFCHRFAPHFKARGQASPAPFLLVDVSDDDDPLWDTYRIDLVPTVIVFEGGRPVSRVGGVLGPGHLEKVLSEGKVP